MIVRFCEFERFALKTNQKTKIKMLTLGTVTKGVLLLDGTVHLSRPRPVSGVNHITPTWPTGNHLSTHFVQFLLFCTCRRSRHGVVWHGMVDVCDGCLAAEASRSSFG